MDNNKSICLTGHRPKSLPWIYDETKETCVKFKKEITKILEETIKKGFINFYVGMAEGFDMIATEILLDLQKKYKHIIVIATIPCLNQEIKWSQKQQERYHHLVNMCNEKIILSENYTPTCMNDRNKYMVDHSSLVIACCNGKPSGTRNTINYAKQKGIPILNCYPFLN